MKRRQSLVEAMRRLQPGVEISEVNLTLHLLSLTSWLWLEQVPENEDTKLVRECLRMLNKTGVLPDDEV